MFDKEEYKSRRSMGLRGQTHAKGSQQDIREKRPLYDKHLEKLIATPEFEQFKQKADGK